MRCAYPPYKLHVYEGADHSPHQCERDRFGHELLRFMEPMHGAQQHRGDH